VYAAFLPVAAPFPVLLLAGSTTVSHNLADSTLLESGAAWMLHRTAAWLRTCVQPNSFWYLPLARGGCSRYDIGLVVHVGTYLRSCVYECTSGIEGHFVLISRELVEFVLIFLLSSENLNRKQPVWKNNVAPRRKTRGH
jgi:hypothetical protein